MNLAVTESYIVSYELMAGYTYYRQIIGIYVASIRDDKRKILIDCGNCHMKHDVTILLT